MVLNVHSVLGLRVAGVEGSLFLQYSITPQREEEIGGWDNDLPAV